VLTDEKSNGQEKRDKCRLALLKTAGGDLLEIYVVFGEKTVH